MEHQRYLPTVHPTLCELIKDVTLDQLGVELENIQGEIEDAEERAVIVTAEIDRREALLDDKAEADDDGQ